MDPIQLLDLMAGLAEDLKVPSTREAPDALKLEMFGSCLHLTAGDDFIQPVLDGTEDSPITGVLEGVYYLQVWLHRSSHGTVGFTITPDNGTETHR